MNDKDTAQDFFKNSVSQYKDEHYGSGYRTFMSVRQERFLEELDSFQLNPDSKILDAGCGPGLLTQEVFKRGFNSFAIDTSPDMLELTRELFSEVEESKRPSIQEGNVEAVPFEDNNFDVIISPGVIEYLENDTKILADFYRALKPGGYMILSVTNKLSPAGYLDFFVEAIKRNKTTLSFCNYILGKIGRSHVRARNFKVRKHFPSEFKRSVKESGLQMICDGYFYVLPWPHPFDRILPNASDKLGKKLEWLSKSWLKGLAEGYYIVAQKPSD